MEWRGHLATEFRDVFTRISEYFECHYHSFRSLVETTLFMKSRKTVFELQSFKTAARASSHRRYILVLQERSTDHYQLASHSQSSRTGVIMKVLLFLANLHLIRSNPNEAHYRTFSHFACKTHGLIEPGITSRIRCAGMCTSSESRNLNCEGFNWIEEKQECYRCHGAFLSPAFGQEANMKDGEHVWSVMHQTWTNGV